MTTSINAAVSGEEYPRVSPESLESIICSALGIAPEVVTEELAYQDIAEWDSMGHVSLMLALEKAYSTKISNKLVSQLTSVFSLRAFVAELSGTKQATPTPPPGTISTSRQDTVPTVHRGLADIYFDRTAITEIDPAGPALRYCGYSVDELVEKASYEETAFLLLHQSLPNRTELKAFSESLRLQRTLPTPIVALLESMSPAPAPPFLALQAALAALGAFTDDSVDADIALIAQVPTLIGAFHRLRTGTAPLAPRDDLGHAANLLYMLSGEVPERIQATALDKAFILLADHSSSASTFTARIVTSTNGGCHAALSGAIAAFSGALHGGAINEVIAMAEAIGSPEAAAAFVRGRLDRNEIIYGFGHRVYRTADPRGRLLQAVARRLCEARGDTRILDILDAVAAVLNDYRRLGVDVNVDFYASAVFDALRIPRDLFGPVFAAARMAGLVAHVREQRRNNVLIRPKLLYTGTRARAYGSDAAR